MDSRMGLSIPEDKEIQLMGSWIPATPGKPIPVRPNLMPVGSYGNQLGQANRQDTARLPSQYLREVAKYNGHIPAQQFGRVDSMVVPEFGQIGHTSSIVDHFNGNAASAERNRMMNHLAGAYTPTSRNVGAGVNYHSLAHILGMNTAGTIISPNNINMANSPTTSNFQSPINWGQGNRGESITNVYSSHDTLSRVSQYGFPLPHCPCYNLNTLPRMENTATSSIPSSVQLTANAIDEAELEKDKFSGTANLSGGKCSTEGEGAQSHLLLLMEDEVHQHHLDGLPNNILSSLSATGSTITEKPKVLEIGESSEAIDLNKTPAQKTLKRRKHRPKVVVEGKPKRATTKATISEEKPTGKRKYERKAVKESAAELADKPTGKRKYVRKKIQESETQQTDSNEETANFNAETAGNSCRRALNFDMESSRYETQGRVEVQKVQLPNNKEMGLDLNAHYTATESSSGANKMHRTSSASHVSQLNKLLVGIHQSEVKTNSISSTNQTPSDCITMSEGQAAAKRAQREHMEMKDLIVNRRDAETRLQQHIHMEGIGQIVFPATTNSSGIDSAGQPMTQNRPQSVSRIFSYPIEGRGSKREHYQIDPISPLNSNPGDSLTMRRDDHCQFSKSIHLIHPETHEKHRVENGFHSRPYVMPSPAAAVESSGPRTCAVGYTAQHNSNFETDAVNRRQNNRVSGVSYNHLMTAMNILSKSQISSELYTLMQRTGETSGLTQSHSLASLSIMKNNILPPIPKASTAPGNQLQPRTDHRDILRQQQTTRLAQSLSSTPRPKVNMVKQQEDPLQDCQQPSANRKGRQATQKMAHPIEEIIHQLEGLHLSERTNEVEHKEQNALVLYKGDGTIVPFEIKKRKPRPKVDLDMETERVWKLLMGKQGSEGLEETDKDKEKWWEEERKVFHGRTDSFIARMHLVQGDRRFSKWKGSVVDSVIGVFLTQNVSDHLSSSAFMSLAAHFPLRPTSCITCDKELPNIMVEQPDIGMQTRETIKCIEELLSSSHNDQSTLTLHESAQDWRDYETLWMDTACMAEAHSHSQEEEVLSSQGSSDSLTVQANGVGSSSGSNSEIEDLPGGSKPNKSHTSSSTDHLQIGSTNLFEEFYSGGLLLHERSKHGTEQSSIPADKQQMPRLDKFDRLEQFYTFTQSPSCSYTQMQKPVFPSSNNGWQATAESEVLEGEGFQLFGEESISSWSLFTSRFSKEASYASQQAESIDNITAQQCEQPGHPGIQIEGPIGSLSTPPEEKQSNSQPYYENQLLGRKMMAYHLEMTSAKKPVNLAEALAKQPDLYSQHISDITKPKGKVVDVEQGIALVDKEAQSGNKLHEQTKGDKLHSTDRVTIEANKYASKTRNGKAEGPPKNAVEWDNLRKDAQARNGRKERSKDTMDSLDYESLRSASVSEISKVIKERGMNNMLAERIKEFLDRLVRDHGSIDLEWLRDVPPEKAKDYLLSIRGLGLKSVECVRLLTLRHLAFPVDTNVGRIVVRLGWVPLQPLPESLQLHLLELYPVLESIQKYLWPRLCKLDQRTLYELHYQMITFGKVFCTKSRPNCNACPMRAECRHFASAFASARLALPGPEEKSLTTSTAPLTTEKNPGIGINHMLLLQPEDSSLHRAGSCIPIVEEPATPEQEQTEVTVSDIEDTFGEDPDEIPTIRLDMEEFSASVQNYVQENMEIQEGDMSKALVVLNTNAASIPMPKLKNVSRLRTEHQVYELPDSHPILKGMDRREPDDPSPYLLAIWTPGETSDSIQLPEQQCESHVADRLCNSKTCFSCNSTREANAQTVRGTLLIPCRTAMRGSFPLNGTYFQVNEMFADHESSLNPLDVPRSWIWNLPRRMVYFGTSVSSIFKGLSTQEIQYCFWKGFVCVRGFDQKARAPRPLVARLHFPASKMVKAKNEKN